MKVDFRHRNAVSRILTTFAVLLLVSTSGEAQNSQPLKTCSLIEFASLDMLTLSDGQFSVPVVMNGRNVLLNVDTGSVGSSITSEVADELGLKRNWTNNGETFMNNVVANQFTTLDSFRIGPLSLDGGYQVLVIPNEMVSPSVSGLLSSDILRGEDVEIDFYRGKFNLFKHNECNGHVVYWTHDPHAAVSMTIDRNNHLNVEALLDGKVVTVEFDTGSTGSTMSLDAARELFGWVEKDPRLQSLGAENINGGEAAPEYRFPFSALSFEGIAIYNPQITLVPKKNFMQNRNHDVTIVLGMSVLRQLHMYIDYQGSMLYLTDAEAK